MVSPPSPFYFWGKNMVFELNNIEIVFIVGAALVVVYFVGSYWKYRKLTSYAHIFEDKLSQTAKVKFHSIGHAGLGIKLEMKDKTHGFKEVYLKLSMGARENLLHYPLMKIMDSYDKISCWGILEKPLKLNIRIVSRNKGKEIKKSEETPNMRKIISEELNEIGFEAYSTNTELARNFLTRSRIAEKLKSLECIELIETDMTSSLIKVVSRLKQDSLFDLVSFLFFLGRTI